MSVFWTVVSGTLVFVVGQFVLKLVIEPINGVKSLVGETAYSLILTANIYANPRFPPDDETRSAQRTLRNMASRLVAARALVPFYSVVYRCFGLPAPEKMDSAVEDLIRLSNSLQNGGGVTNARTAQRIKDDLRIHTPLRDRVDGEQ